MQTSWKKMCLLVAACAALMLGGCGEDGKDGAAGTPGTDGKDAGVVVKVADLTAENIKTLSLSGTVTKVSIPDSGKPEVSFKIADKSGRGVTGLTGYLARFTIATLVPGTNGAPDEWLNYLQRKTTSAANGWPTSDAGGKLTDNGDGSYLYAFDTSIKKDVPHTKTTFHPVDVAYVPTQTHRIGFTIDGQPAGAVARITTLPFIYDFVPAGGTPTVSREVTSKEACNTCHDDLTTVLTKSGGTHSRGRGDVRFCVMCHTKQGGALEANTASVNGAFPDPSKSVQVADNEIIGYFPNMIHKFHMGNKLAKTGYNFWGAKFNEIKYPQDIRNCQACHSSSAQADNWKAKPTRQACGSCHDDVNFATGANHVTGGPQANDQLCAMCHTAAGITAYHPTKLPATTNAALRTMSAKISGVTVDANGGVTVKFTVTDGNAAVTDMTKFTKPSFSLVKLVKGADGAYKWVSYTANFRTKDPAMAPVLQARTENTGTLTANADGSFSYKFKLANGSTEGDIRTIDHAHNASATSLVPATYTPANWPQGPNVVAYEPTKTHRVAMTFQKVGTPNVDANNTWFDFKPAGGAVTETRNIVTMKNCASCHNNKKLHAAYEVEVCVTCHTQDTKDSLTGQSVDLQTLVHKLHMGKDLPSVKAGGEYRINSAAGGSHDYTKLGYPGIISNCRVCHVEGSGAPSNAANWRTNPTANACITCHDGASSVAHAAQNANSCATCHSSGRTAGADVAHQ